MKPQPIPDGSLSEEEAFRVVRGLCALPTRRQPEDRQRHALLARTVEDEVIPRLLTASRRRTSPSAEAMPDAVTGEHVNEIIQLVLQGNQTEATDYVGALQNKGVPSTRVFLDLLAPAARKLGQMWEDDCCDFADVTMGVMRLRNVMRMIGESLEMDCPVDPAAPRILLFQAPGEQHGFGLAMVTHFFRAAGFSVRSENAPTVADILSLVRNEWFSLAGVSVACTDQLPSVTQLLADMRRASRNPQIGLMAGGSAFALQQVQPAEIGADLGATDGLQAVYEAKALLGRLAHER